MSRTPAFSTWLDQFFASYYRHRPVNATFIGVHEFDDRLPDYSKAGVAAVLEDVNRLLDQLQALPEELLTTGQALDQRLAAGFLAIQRWELGSGHFQAGNPSVYTSEAAFGILSLLRRPFAPLAERLAHAAARMEAIPELLSQGQQNLRTAPPAWAERALNECAGLRKLLRGGVQQLMIDKQCDSPAVHTAAAHADTAVDAFESFLRTLPPSDTYACGPNAFDLYLREGHFLRQSAAEIAAYAESQIAECAAYLQEHAAEFGADDWRGVLAQLSALHPSIAEYDERYGQVWDACKATADQHQLVTWPDYPIRYVPRPRWVRDAAAHLYFLFYHAPAPFEDLPEVEYLTTPIEPTLPAKEQERLLRTTNDSVIKLNHVVHHGALGHHLQNWHAYHQTASRIGTVAAVDCASRIAMFCGGTMAEGWACYATDLMGEYGFLTPLERYAERHGRLRMAARALADVRIHHGQWSLEEAATFYETQIGMAPAAAHGEAVKNSMFPGTATMYLMGTDGIHQLRRTLSSDLDFNLQSFHDRLLSFGSVPVALVAELMLDDG